MSEYVIEVRALGKCYPIGVAGQSPFSWRHLCKSSFDMLRRKVHSENQKNHHWALNNISFNVKRGERIGVIGRNGAGKSTLLKIMSRVAYPTTGEIRIRGTLTSLLEVGTGFNDNLTGRENVFLNASLYGLSRTDVESRFNDIVAFSEIGRFIDTPVKNYSSGMKMRLAFSVAAHLDPDILLLDEVLAVGDMSFQRKCLERVDQLTSGGRTLFFVSHSMDSVIRYCDRCIWLDNGIIRMDGEVQEVVSAYVEAVLGVRSNIVVEQNNDNIELQNSGQENQKLCTTTETNSVGEDGLSNCSFLLNSPSKFRAGASLIKASVINRHYAEKALFRVDEQIGIQMHYNINEPGLFVPAIHVYCPQGTLVFAAVPPINDPEELKYHQPAMVSSLAWLPVDFLNIGTYTVSLIVFSPDEAPFKRHFIHEQMLSFHCVEAVEEKKSARGLMPRGFPGPIRPLLQWSVANTTQSSERP